jgi:hypothetical protein
MPDETKRTAGPAIYAVEDLRGAQRHALLLAQKRATTKLAMFLELLEHLQLAGGEPALEIYQPMDRTSIAAYLGLTLAALSRAFRTLVSKQIISSRDRHHIKILIGMLLIGSLMRDPTRLSWLRRHLQMMRVGLTPTSFAVDPNSTRC